MHHTSAMSYFFCSDDVRVFVEFVLVAACVISSVPLTTPAATNTGEAPGGVEREREGGERE